MFDRLFEFISKVWEYIIPCEVVKVYEGGGVLRLGKYHRTIGPGLVWKIPLAEDVVTVSTAITTIRLPPQTLTTKDGKTVVVTAIVKYQIDDVEPYITKIWDQGDVLADTTMGAVGAVVSKSDWKDLLESGIDVIGAVRKEVRDYGFKVLKITFIDFGQIRSIRLLQQSSITNLDN